MTGRRYRIKTPTMAILSSDGRRRPVTVPADVIVAISGELAEGGRLVDVIWNNPAYLMFTQDLRDRCELVS